MPDAPVVLLAKRSRDVLAPREDETLLGHTLAVVKAARSILEAVGQRALNSFGLTDGMLEQLKNAVLRAALLHDLGKANSHFQRLIQGESTFPQALRHEWISAWLPLVHEPFARWLFAGTDYLVREAVLAAVLGHHLKVGDGAALVPRCGSGDTEVVCYFQHPGFRQLLKEGGDLLSLPREVPVLSEIRIDLLDDCALSALLQWLGEKADLKKSDFVAISKVFAMAADLVGSARPSRPGLTPEDWAMETLSRCCEPSQMEEISAKRIGGSQPREFQLDMHRSRNRVTLVRAGCGSGKTIGAYMWAQERARGRKLFLCYPTTGTATEGYHDYILPADMEADAALLHSRSEVDIEEIMEGEVDSLIEHGFGIAALASWDVPVTICTVDYVLGIIQNSRRSLYASPAFMNAAFVFDEIHQYDSRLFGALLRFLEAWSGAPVLLMTASLPRSHLAAIKGAVGELDVIDGPDDYERLPRYQLEGPIHEIPWACIRAAIANNQKVLCICNTIDRCVRVATQAEQEYAIEPVLPYHSRYRYADRIQRHRDVMNAFARTGPAMAVTTQVCEISLDLSADLLISDMAPVPSLIQRLGRLNRRATPDEPGTPRTGVFLKVPLRAPYGEAETDQAYRWLPEFTGKVTCQRDLAEGFEGVCKGVSSHGRLHSKWLDGGAFSDTAPLREAGFVVPVARQEDLEAITSVGQFSSKEVVRNEIPMPLGPVAAEITRWKKWRHAWVAPRGRICYSTKWGARWVKD